MPDVRVHTYASPDPDSVNTHIVETADGVVIVSVQRTFSEAARAIAFIERIGKPVSAMVIPVPHTDHYGGLSAFAAAFPKARRLASAATIQSIRTDGEGYIASRKAALGDDFPSFEQFQAALPAEPIRDGQEINVGGVVFRVIDLPDNNAPTNTLLHVPAANVLFTSEIVENAVTGFMRDANLDTWLSQVTALSKLPASTRIYPGHGHSGPLDTAIRLQRGYLDMHRELLDASLKANAGVLTDAEKDRVSGLIDARYPDFRQVARLPRKDLIAFNLTWQAAKRKALIAT